MANLKEQAIKAYDKALKQKDEAGMENALNAIKENCKNACGAEVEL